MWLLGVRVRAGGAIVCAWKRAHFSARRLLCMFFVYTGIRTRPKLEAKVLSKGTEIDLLTFENGGSSPLSPRTLHSSFLSLCSQRPSVWEFRWWRRAVNGWALFSRQAAYPISGLDARRIANALSWCALCAAERADVTGWAHVLAGENCCDR